MFQRAWAWLGARMATFLTTVSVLTYILNVAFARPGPYCSIVTFYDQEADFPHHSGHVSRATGALTLLSGKNRSAKTLIAEAILQVFISRIVLGMHYFADVIGAVFLLLETQKILTLATSLLSLPERFTF